MDFDHAGDARLFRPFDFDIPCGADRKSRVDPLRGAERRAVMSAQAGIQKQGAGQSSRADAPDAQMIDPPVGHQRPLRTRWIPACAGMTRETAAGTTQRALCVLLLCVFYLITTEL